MNTNKECYKHCRIVAMTVLIFFQSISYASEISYKSYVEIGSAQYFGQGSNLSDRYDLFLPLIHRDNNLFFADLRIFGRSTGSFETGTHLGFRKIDLDAKRIFGFYGSFDCRRNSNSNRFMQIMFGGEYWQDRWFIGGNLYQPLGNSKKLIAEHREHSKRDSKKIYITKYYEQALSGADLELGYALTDSLTIYAGGYYFYARDVSPTTGPKLRFAYNYNKSHGRLLGILDGLAIEAGIQHDKPRGTTACVGIKFKIGFTSLESNSNVFGFERHMVEPVRRDPDIIIGRFKQEVYQFKAELLQKSAKSQNATQYSKPSENNQLQVTKRSSDDPLLPELLEKFDLPQNATINDVKKKYRKYALKYHPDRCRGDDVLKTEMTKKFIYYTELHELIEKNMTKAIR